MKRAYLVVVLLLFLSVNFPHFKSSASPTSDKRRLELKVKAFPDLYFYVYRLALATDKQTNVAGLGPAIEAAHYLDGKISRDEALNRMVDAFVKARGK